MSTPFAIAVELDGEGAHPAAWRAAAQPPQQLLTGARLAARGREAERFGFTAITLQDSPLPPEGPPGITARLDAIQRAAYLAPLTTSIALVPVGSTIATEPFHLATQLASLDHASGGRAGWLVEAGDSVEQARAFGRETVKDAPALRRESDDVVEVVRRLWDSWEDDAVIREVATGRYLDREKLHYVDFEGAEFSVKGPLITPRPPQGQLVVAAAPGTTALRGVDVALVRGEDEQSITAAAAQAREQWVPRVFAELEVALDRHGVPAARRIQQLDEHQPWAPSGRLRYAGDAAGLAALLVRLAAHVDGVRLLPAVLDAELDELGRRLLPALRRGAGFASPRVGATARETLGLERPANRYEGSRA